MRQLLQFTIKCFNDKYSYFVTVVNYNRKLFITMGARITFINNLEMQLSAFLVL
jgi:hypothetical protein